MSQLSSHVIINDILPSSLDNGYDTNPHQSTNLLAEAAESIQHNDFEKLVADAADGEEFNELLQSLPFSVYSNGQSLTYNRVIKVLIREGLLDANQVVAWNRANKSVKEKVYNVIRKISIVTPNELLLKMKAAALKKDVKKVKKTSKLTKEERIQIDSKAALVAHAIVDPSIQPILIEFWKDNMNKSVSSADDILALVLTKAVTYSNIFGHADFEEDIQRHHRDMYEINPSLAEFTTGEHFLRFIKIMKLKYDDLVGNISKMVMHSAEELIPDQVVFQLTYKDGAYDYGLLYCYFLWKGHDLSFIPSVPNPKLVLSKKRRSDSSQYPRSKRSSFESNRDISLSGMGSNFDAASMSSTSDDGILEMAPTSAENARLREEAYIAAKNASANLMNVRAEIEARNAALSDRERELELLRNAINDKSFEKLNAEQQTHLRTKYSELLMHSQSA